MIWLQSRPGHRQLQFAVLVTSVAAVMLLVGCRPQSARLQIPETTPISSTVRSEPQ